MRDFIARTWLGRDGLAHRLGSVQLHESQNEAVTRISAAIAEFGGALLCDDVGMGKTFTGLAVIAGARNPLVIAPASLRGMWAESLARGGVQAAFVTVEQLSRGSVPDCHDVILVDEAHHFRNRKTLRFANLAACAGDASIVLMTATPVHNRRQDLFVLLSLFLGTGAAGLTEEEIGRCLIRRTQQSSDTPAAPRIEYRERFSTADDAQLLRLLVELPPAAPPRGSGTAEALVVQGLVRQWASTDAALAAALLRRINLALALLAALEADRYPTRGELRAWIGAEGTLQFGFPEMLASTSTNTASLAGTVMRHRDALLRAYDIVRDPERVADVQRADIIRSISARHSGERVIVFSQFASSVRGMYERLKSSGGVAALTASGGVIASGVATREEILRQFDPRAKKAHDRQAIKLLLATDLASEGVNLQEASAVVHLDLPWTHARLEQRVGRVARIGSRHSIVSVYTIEPPASAERLLETEVRILRKHSSAERLIGGIAQGIPGGRCKINDARAVAMPEAVESIASALRGWIGASQHFAGPSIPLIGAVESRCIEGFFALISMGHGARLISQWGDGACSAEIARVARSVAACEGISIRPDHPVITLALKRCAEWINQNTLGDMAGVERPSTHLCRRAIGRIDRAWSHLSSRRRVELMHDFRFARELISSRMSAGREAQVAELLARITGDDIATSLTVLARQSKVTTATRTLSQVVAIILFQPKALRRAGNQ